MTTLLIGLGTWTTAGAQEAPLAGKWSVAGTNPEGDKYRGDLQIDAINSLLYQLRWDVQYEGEPQRDEFPGTALYDKDNQVMYAAYGIGTLRYGLVVYPLNEKGGLEGEGQWTSHQGIGAELLAGKLNRKNIAGTYQVVGRRSKGDVELGASETYQGTLSITKDGDVYNMTWTLGDGAPYSGFAYKTGGQLVGAWGIGGSYGLEIYTFDNMNQATATWVTPSYKNGQERGSETITRQ